MKKMLFLLLFIPFISFSQEKNFLEALPGLKSDSTSKYIKLPPLWQSDFYKYYEVGRKSSYRHVITNDTTYYSIFAKYHKDSLPFIDFNKQELVASIACSQCLVYCKHEGWNNEPCHRNACRYSEVWFLRDKRKGSDQ